VVSPDFDTDMTATRTFVRSLIVETML